MRASIAQRSFSVCPDKLHVVDDTVPNLDIRRSAPELGKPQGWTDNRERVAMISRNPKRNAPGANRSNTCVRVTPSIRCGEAFDANESER